MAKLSDPMIKVLRHLAEGGMPGRMAPAGSARTVDALKARWLIADTPRGYRLTINGRTALAMLDATGAPAVEAKPTDRATFHPADGIGVAMPDPAGPSVRLTPAPADTKREATDAEVLQLLAVLDAGGIVHRALYREWGVLDAGPFRLDLDAVNRAARDAVRFALARQTFANHEYVLTAEPIHLDAGNGRSACGISLNGSTIRHRLTSDPAKVTHERCRPIKAGDVVRFKDRGSGRTYDVTEVDTPDGFARVWTRLPEDSTEEARGQWVPLHLLERVTK